MWNFLKAREIRQLFGSSYLLYNGSIFCCFLTLLSLVGSENLKNLGANSTNHFGSMAVTSRMYSFVVSTSSWYTTLKNTKQHLMWSSTDLFGKNTEDNWKDSITLACHTERDIHNSILICYIYIFIRYILDKNSTKNKHKLIHVYPISSNYKDNFLLDSLTLY